MSGVSEAAVLLAAEAIYVHDTHPSSRDPEWADVARDVRLLYVESARAALVAAYPAIRADIAAEVLAPIEAVAHSAVKRSSARGPYIETVSVEELSAALSAANDNGATSPHETAPNAAQGNLASLAGTSATKEATWDEVGGSMWLDRHQWGVIIDGLVLQRAEALTRKAANEYSNSDERAEMCVDLIRRINAADSLALSAAKEATNDE